MYKDVLRNFNNNISILLMIIGTILHILLPIQSVKQYVYLCSQVNTINNLW